MGTFACDRFTFDCKRCGACCSPMYAGDYQCMPWSDEEQTKIAEHLGMTRTQLRQYLEFYPDGNAFPINPKGPQGYGRCKLCIDDPAEKGKTLCRAYPVQANNCGQYPNVGLLSTADGLAKRANICPGLTVLDAEALALIPHYKAEREDWLRRKPWLGTWKWRMGKRIRKFLRMVKGA